MHINEKSLMEIVPESPIVRIEEVTHGYGPQKQKNLVIKNCSLEIPYSKTTVLIGPSGCGKTTLARLIAGFELPDFGSISMNNLAIKGPSFDRLMVFQETALFSWMSTEENINFGPKVRGENSAETKDALSKMFDIVGLAPFRRKYPTQLSGGMQRRAELARALVNNPKLMILDEPFRGLDAMTKVLMQQHFNELMANSSASCVFITSDIDEAILIADQIVITTNRPLQVAATFTVPFPRPRSQKQLIENDDANKLKSAALEVLHFEAMKSFASGSKAAEDFLRAYSVRNSST